MTSTEHEPPDDSKPSDSQNETPAIAEPYEVGYGKPPKDTRFKKGRSGNPFGRPRKIKPKQLEFSDRISDELLQGEIFRPVNVIENGKATEMPTLKALYRALTVSGLKGNRLATQYLIKKLEEKEEAYFELKLRRYMRLKADKENGERILAQHKMSGTEPPELIPHPDDIKLNDDTLEADVHGPETKAEAQQMAFAIRLRNLLYKLAIRTVGLKRLTWKEDGEARIDSSYLFATLIDRSIAKRCRWSNSLMLDLYYEATFLTKREWEKWFKQEKAWLTNNTPSTITPEITAKVQRIFNKCYEEAEKRRRVA